MKKRGGKRGKGKYQGGEKKKKEKKPAAGESRALMTSQPFVSIFFILSREKKEKKKKRGGKKGPENGTTPNPHLPRGFPAPPYCFLDLTSPGERKKKKEKRTFPCRGRKRGREKGEERGRGRYSTGLEQLILSFWTVRALFKTSNPISPYPSKSCGHRGGKEGRGGKKRLSWEKEEKEEKKGAPDFGYPQMLPRVLPQTARMNDFSVCNSSKGSKRKGGET